MVKVAELACWDPLGAVLAPDLQPLPGVSFLVPVRGEGEGIEVGAVFDQPAGYLRMIIVGGQVQRRGVVGQPGVDLESLGHQGLSGLHTVAAGGEV